MKMRIVSGLGFALAGLLGSFGIAHAQTVHIITGQGSSDADGVPALTARMLGDSTNVIAPDGTIYFTETSGRVRKITPSGNVYTIAGRNYTDCGFSGDGGPATAARLCYPSGIALDTSGNLYVADTSNYRIRKISNAGIITTIAGSGVYGFSGDGGQAINARLSGPSWMTFDASGSLYFTDQDNNRIRKINGAGIITTVAGSGSTGYPRQSPSYSGDGGQATSALLDTPEGIAIDAAGNLYISDAINNRVRKVTPAGVISTIAGTGPTGFRNGGYAGDGGSALTARLSTPQGLATDGAGNLYIADRNNLRVRKIDNAGVITTVAGNGTDGTLVDGSDATTIGFIAWGVSTDVLGNLYLDSASSGKRYLVKVDMPACTSAQCMAAGVEEGIVEALDAGAVSSAIATQLIDRLAPITANLQWMAANPTSPDLANVKRDTCSAISQDVTYMDHLVRQRRLPSSYRDEWKADLAEIKVDIGC